MRSKANTIPCKVPTGVTFSTFLLTEPLNTVLGYMRETESYCCRKVSYFGLYTETNNMHRSGNVVNRNEACTYLEGL